MKMKRVLALLLAALMLVGVMAGCQSAKPADDTAAVTPDTSGEAKQPDATETPAESDAEPAEEVTLEVAVFEGAYGRAFWDAIAASFEASHPGVTVSITANPEISEIIRPNILSGNPPDLIYLPSSNASGIAQALIKDHALVDLNDVLADIEDQFLPGFLDSSKCQPYGDGHTYLVPLYYTASGLWFNKTYFEENDLEVPTTWDEFFTLGDWAKEHGRALYTYQGIYPGYNEIMLTPAIASAGGIEGLQACANYESGAWTNPDIVKSLENFAKIGTGGYLMDGTVALDHTQAQSEWLMGKALFHPNGSWVEGEMKDAAREEGFEFGFTAPPVLDANKDKYVFATVDEIYIPTAAKNVELAKEFLKFLFTDEAIQLNAENALGVPPIKGACEKLKGLVSDAVYESYLIFEKGYKPVVETPFNTVADTEIAPATEFYNQIGDVMMGNETVETWIEKTEAISAQVCDKIVK